MKDVLILEDSDSERERLQRVLSEAGYSVQGCATVAQAEALFKAERFRLLVLDIGLEDKSGSYFFGLARRTDPSTAIVVFTGNPSVHLKERFIAEGAADYIVKGSRAAQGDQLCARIKELIGEPEKNNANGIALDIFLNNYVSATSRPFFCDESGDVLPCAKCGGREYMVTFSQATQVPPDVKGLVVCAQCGTVFDQSVG